MQTSHVLRGDEWISSTPKHILLYQAFGWEAPYFCHLPVILAAGGGKLSKRKGAASVGDFRDLGYLPYALVNFLSLLGWSPGDDREVMELKEMIDAFSLERIHPKAVSFDEKKLEWMNGMHIRLLPDSFFAEKLKELYPDNPEIKYLKVSELLKPRLKFTTELAAMSRYFFVRPEKIEDEKAFVKFWTEQSPEYIKLIASELETIQNFDTKNIEAAFTKVCENSGAKLGTVAQSVRLKVCGVGAGPGLWEILECLGTAECILRLK
jgi:glutamyl-tRNA synthetase